MRAVSELSLPGKQCRFSGRRSSSFHFVKRTKTAARTRRAIYTARRRVRLRAKSCLGQEMRRACNSRSLFSPKTSTLSPFSVSRSYALFTNRIVLLRTFLLSRKDTRDEYCVTSTSFKFLLFASMFGATRFFLEFADAASKSDG